MWQRAIEIRKSTTGDGRDVVDSKRSWENKHSTVLQGGKGRQEGVTGGDSPSSIPDVQVWGGDSAACLWAGNTKWSTLVWRTSRDLGKQRKQPATWGGRTGSSPTHVLLLGVTAWYQVSLWESTHVPTTRVFGIHFSNKVLLWAVSWEMVLPGTR